MTTAARAAQAALPEMFRNSEAVSGGRPNMRERGFSGGGDVE